MDTNSEDREPAGGTVGLDPEQRAELLKRGWALLARKDYPALQTLLEPLPEIELVREPELGFMLAAAWRRQGVQERAYRLICKLNEVCRKHTDTRFLLDRKNLEGAILLQLGRLAEAEACMLEVYDLANEAGEEYFLAVSSTNLGIISDIRCLWSDALTFYQRALSAFYGLGRQWEIGLVHQNIAMTYMHLGMLRESSTHSDYAHSIARNFGSPDEQIGTELHRALLFCRARICEWRKLLPNVL